MSANPVPPHDTRDAQGFVTLMRPALVKYFTRKTGSSAEAEDLTQDVLVRALTHGVWKSADHAKGYIFRIAVNRWRDRLRRLQAQGVPVAWEEAAPHEANTQISPEQVVTARQELHQIVRAMEELHVRTRTVLVLVRLERMRVATVAEMLGISVSAVNKHLARGIAHLAQLRSRQDLP